MCTDNLDRPKTTPQQSSSLKHTPSQQSCSPTRRISDGSLRQETLPLSGRTVSPSLRDSKPGTSGQRSTESLPQSFPVSASIQASEADLDNTKRISQPSPNQQPILPKAHLGRKGSSTLVGWNEPFVHIRPSTAGSSTSHRQTQVTRPEKEALQESRTSPDSLAHLSSQGRARRQTIGIFTNMSRPGPNPHQGHLAPLSYHHYPHEGSSRDSGLPPRDRQSSQSTSKIEQRTWPAERHDKVYEREMPSGPDGAQDRVSLPGIKTLFGMADKAETGKWQE